MISDTCKDELNFNTFSKGKRHVNLIFSFQSTDLSSKLIQLYAKHSERIKDISTYLKLETHSFDRP